MSLAPDWNNLICEYISDFLNKQTLPYVVSQSIPIVWFGNIDKYKASPKKIVTIGLNPSLNEFSVSRFGTVDLTANDAADELTNTLNLYFSYNPYKWFNNFEKALNQLDASYYENKNKENIAVHIDIYSAIATNPTWGGLSEDQQNEIQSIDLFKKLLNLLNPDVIIFSANRAVFEQVFPDFNLIKSASCVTKKGLFLKKYQCKDKILFNVRNFRGQPFGGLTDYELQAAMQELLGDGNNTSNYTCDSDLKLW